jgi:hypothetical protein
MNQEQQEDDSGVRRRRTSSWTGLYGFAKVLQFFWVSSPFILFGNNGTLSIARGSTSIDYLRKALYLMLAGTFLNLAIEMVQGLCD